MHPNVFTVACCDSRRMLLPGHVLVCVSCDSATAPAARPEEVAATAAYHRAAPNLARAVHTPAGIQRTRPVGSRPQ